MLFKQFKLTYNEKLQHARSATKTARRRRSTTEPTNRAKRMKLIIPAILLSHWIGIFIYFTVIRTQPDQWYNYSWSVYYFSITQLTIINYGLVFVLAPYGKLGCYSKQFVLVDILFTLALSFFVILENAKIINSTYGFYISILGMIISTILIVINGIRYGYNKEYEND